MVGRSWPVISPRSVVLPAPLGPSRPWAPAPSSTVTSLTPITEPKTFVTCVRESMGALAKMMGQEQAIGR